MKSVILAAACGLLVTAAAQAGGMTSWSGRDLDAREVWTCNNIGGDEWVLRRTGLGAVYYTAVSSSDDYVELQAKGTRTFDRVRLYKDRLTMNDVGSRLRWIDMAKGRWDR